jgi:hypothetical protein
MVNLGYVATNRAREREEKKKKIKSYCNLHTHKHTTSEKKRGKKTEDLLLSSHDSPFI